MLARPTFSLVESMRTAAGSGLVPVSDGSGGLSMGAPAPAAHKDTHNGSGSDSIDSLGAVTFTGAIDFDTATVINGLTDGNLLLTDTAGTDFGFLQLGGVSSSFPAFERSGAAVRLRLADDSAYARLHSSHIGISAAPTDTHMLYGDEQFTGGTGNRLGVGMFPTYMPAASVANNLYGVQGNVFFGSANWGANSNVNAMQFYPAPDYQYGSVAWGSANLNLIGVTTGGMINILGKTVTANALIGIGVSSLSHIFGAPGAVTANRASGIEIATPSQTTGTIGVQTGLVVEPQLYATLNQGIWLAGDNSVIIPPLGGSDIVFGAGKDAAVFYDGSNFIIDPDRAGSGIVLIGTTGDDDMRLNDIEIDGALNHDGSAAGFYNTAPITKPTVTGSRAGNAALASALTQLANLGLITDSSTA